MLQPMPRLLQVARLRGLIVLPKILGDFPIADTVGSPQDGLPRRNPPFALLQEPLRVCRLLHTCAFTGWAGDLRNT